MDGGRGTDLEHHPCLCRLCAGAAFPGYRPLSGAGGDGMRDRCRDLLSLASGDLAAARLTGSGAGMGVAVDVEQMGGVDLRIDLRGRQAGVAEQFLQAAQIRAATQQMRGEAVAQGVGRGAL